MTNDQNNKYDLEERTAKFGEEIIKRYQRVKMRTLNLKRAWEKVFGK